MADTFFLKQRTIGPAKKNPFRPRQRTKRGPWRTVEKSYDLATLFQRFRVVSAVGFADRAIFFRGNRITNALSFIEPFWQEQLGVDSTGKPQCICPSECDCENPEPESGTALISNNCPVHNLVPSVAPGCEAAAHRNGAVGV